MGRTPFYYIGVLFLFAATLLILIALFTSHWSKTASYLITNTYNSYGLWFICSHYGREFYNREFYQNRPYYQSFYGFRHHKGYSGWQPVPADNSCLPILYNYGMILSLSFVFKMYFISIKLTFFKFHGSTLVSLKLKSLFVQQQAPCCTDNHEK
jgi:hypothetical protein